MNSAKAFHSLSTAGIILAAGGSTRMGRPKQLLRIAGEMLLSRVVKMALASDLDKVVIVLGHQAKTVIASLGSEKTHPKTKIVINERYKAGMSTSLQAGLNAVRNFFPTVMVLLGDQPYVDTATVNLLLHCFRRTKQGICVPMHKGRKGLPVCFRQRFYDDIMQISGDRGARKIIRNHPEQLFQVTIDNPDCFFDIDNEVDLEAARNRLHSIQRI
jgi:molybdenum cofactor cytidylyltransferase